MSPWSLFTAIAVALCWAPAALIFAREALKSRSTSRRLRDAPSACSRQRGGGFEHGRRRATFRNRSL